MTTTKAQRKSTIDQPQELGRFTLHPVTFGLLEWLQTTRKNPLICGGQSEVRHAMELCWAFTIPSKTLCAVPPASIAAKICDFQNGLTPQEFFRIQKHAETELLKFSQTSVAPKKKPTPRQRLARK